MEDKSKGIKEKLESSKKIIRDKKVKRDWVGGALLVANSELNGRNNELGRDWNIILDLEKIVELSNSMNKEDNEHYEAQILELGNTIKEYQDCLSREQLEKEKIHRGYLHEKLQLGKASEKIKNL